MVRDFEFTEAQKEWAKKNDGTAVVPLGLLIESVFVSQEIEKGYPVEQVESDELVLTVEYWVHILSEFALDHSTDRALTFERLVSILDKAHKVKPDNLDNEEG